MEIYKIVHKLIGETRPTGDASRDTERLQNMKKLIALTDRLIIYISDVACRNRDSQESSVLDIVSICRDFLDTDIKE